MTKYITYITSFSYWLTSYSAIDGERVHDISASRIIFPYPLFLIIHSLLSCIVIHHPSVLLFTICFCLYRLISVCMKPEYLGISGQLMASWRNDNVEYAGKTGPCLPQGRMSLTLTITVLISDRKCKNIFVSLIKMDSSRKWLIAMVNRCDMRVKISSIFADPIVSGRSQGPLLLTWFNFNPSMDK